MESEDGDEQPPTIQMGWHRVCLNTIVRATKELGSARLRILPMGSRVHLVEVQGRRVRIDQPIDGWCSIESSNGDQILSPIQTDNHNSNEIVGPQSVGSETEREKNDIENKKENIAKELHLLRNEVNLTQGISDDLKEVKHQLSQAKQQVEKLNQTNQSQRSKIDLLTAELGKKEPGTALQSRIQELERQNEESDRQLAQLKKISEQREIENQNLKTQMKDVADTYVVPSSNTSNQTAFQNGDVALMKNGDLVIIRYCGPVEFDKGDSDYIGVELSDPIGTSDGKVGDKRYFTCKDKFGMFYEMDSVKKKIPAEFLLQKLHKLMTENERGRTAKE